MSDETAETVTLVDMEPWQDPSDWGMVEERAARGLAWLREEGPRFGLDADRINPQRLNMVDPLNCALAHAAGSEYNRTIRQITGRDSYDDMARGWAIAHGFMSDDCESFVILTSVWRQLLAPVTVE